MKRFALILVTLFLAPILMLAQGNVGIGTTTPQAKLHVNGTFALENGVIVNGISTDSTMTPGSDSLLPTQLAVKKYITQGAWAPKASETDSGMFVKSFINTSIGSLRAVEVQGDYAYVCGTGPNRLSIFNISDPDSIVAMAFTETNPWNPIEMTIHGNYAYVITFLAPYLRIFDISDPNNIVLHGLTSTSLDHPTGIFVNGNIAYLASPYNNTLSIFDVSDPDNILLLGSTTSGLTYPIDVAVSNNIAYVANNQGNSISVFDVSNPSMITPVQTMTDGVNQPRQVHLGGSHAYVYSFAQPSLSIYDISNPAVMVLQSSINIPIANAIGEFSVAGSKAYITASNDKIYALDVTNPVAPHIIDSLVLQGTYKTCFAVNQNIYVTGDENKRLTILEWGLVKQDELLIRQPDGTLGFQFNGWTTDKHENVFKENGYVGIGTSAPDYRLDVRGRIRLGYGGTPYNTAGVWFGKTNQTNAAFLGLKDDQFFGFFTGGTWRGGFDASSGNFGLGTLTPTAILHVNGPTKISESNTIEFGADTPGKEINAGKIAYQNFSPNALDIVGAGSSASDRRIQFWGKTITTDTAFFSGAGHFNSNVSVSGNAYINGSLGIGTPSPTASLHINGVTKIEGANWIEFGAGVPGKESYAGTMGYNTFSINSLDIVGSGNTSGDRRVTLWDKIIVPDSAFFFGHANFNGNVNVVDNVAINNGNLHLLNGSIGIGTPSPAYRLDINGRMRVRHAGGNSAGIFFNRSDNTLGGFVGMRDDSHVGLFGSPGGDWSFVMNINNGNVGIGTWVTPTAKLHVAGDVKINGTYPLEFGADVMGKQVNAGKIGYQTFSVNALDIVGAGTAPGNRRIMLWDKIIVPDSAFFFGAVNFNQNVRLNNPLLVDDHIRITYDNVLEFNYNDPFKDPNSGKIGYQTFTPGALDIVGAGSTPATRKVKIHADGGLEISGQIVGEAWSGMTLMNNWTNYGGDFATAAYYKDHEGVVHLRGLISGGNNVLNTVIANLPAGYRPTYGTLIFAVVNGVNTTGRIDVRANGDVVFQGTTNTFISMNEISFRTY